MRIISSTYTDRFASHANNTVGISVGTNFLGASSGKTACRIIPLIGSGICPSLQILRESTREMGSRRYADPWWFVLACV